MQTLNNELTGKEATVEYIASLGTIERLIFVGGGMLVAGLVLNQLAVWLWGSSQTHK